MEECEDMFIDRIIKPSTKAKKVVEIEPEEKISSYYLINKIRSFYIKTRKKLGIKFYGYKEGYCDEYDFSGVIHDVAEYGDVDSLIKVMECGITHNCMNHHRAKPAHFAVLNPDRNVLIKLIDLGADLNSRDYQGLQPIHYWARYNGPTDNLKILLDHGVDINTQSFFNCIPLQYALEELNDVRTSTNNINALIIHGADIRVLDE